MLIVEVGDLWLSWMMDLDGWRWRGNPILHLVPRGRPDHQILKNLSTIIETTLPLHHMKRHKGICNRKRHPA
jgi:hypothetical protein